ncbi:hypothetical protein SAMN04488011_101841 [Palleronia pelagia]|uniref:Uncharacterized protein n=1 Tax=Palleronia pelagia TaxID=387096 RepID=A0A1H8C5G8_9RHOB|nr:hypothetical protein SAMN04488011_101841 [Palleronia pelagia]
MPLGFIDRAQVVWIAELLAHLVGLQACPFRDGIDLTVNIERDEASPITTGKHVTFLFKGMGKGFFGI